MKTLIDMTKRRKSRAIEACPVCGRKAHSSIEYIGSSKNVSVHRVHYLHRAWIENETWTWFDKCIVDHVSGESLQIVKEQE